jgi:CrcB protein
VLAAVAVGGFAGGVARHAIATAWPSPSNGFPWHTFVVNVSGAFGLALALVLILETFVAGRLARAAIGTGFFGAFTTSSTYMVEADLLIDHGHSAVGAGYVLSSAAAGLLAAATGVMCGWLLSRGRRRAQ